MRIRLSLVAGGGICVSFLGWNYFSSAASSSSSSRATISGASKIRQQESCKDLPIYQRFVSFASSSEKVAEGADGAVVDVPCMTVLDFVNSLTTASPEEKGEGGGAPSSATNNKKSLDAVLATNAQLKKDFDKLISLVDTDKSGSIDFREYATLQTLLAAPVEQLKGALELFDRSNTQRVNVRQFKALLRSMSSGHLGSSNVVVATTAGGGANATTETESALGDGTSALAKFFFGENGDQTVSFQDFVGRVSEIRSLVRTIEFHLALSSAKNKNATKTSLASVRQRMTGVPLYENNNNNNTNNNTGEEGKNTKPKNDSSPSAVKIIDEAAPLVSIDDYMVFMALLSVAHEWTPALKLFLENNAEKNIISYDMLSRVLTDTDISTAISASTAAAMNCGLRVDKSRGGQHHARVFSTKQQADMFSQLMDNDHDRTIDVAEVQKIAKAHTSFFAAFVPQFKEVPRNVIQQWFYCMQQKA